MEEMFEDYEKYTGIRYHFGYASGNENDYFEDLVSRSTRGGSGRNPKNIDLIIVADQLLTGYDSKRLNTLYVDRELELQSLIQAYSRTNRVYGKEKEFGSIVNFKYPRITEEAVNRALKLYGAGGSNSVAIVDKYEVAVKKFNVQVKEMRLILDDPTKWSDLKYDIVRKEAFIEYFKLSARQLNKVKQYYQFVWDDNSFGIDEHTWLRYVGAYKNLIDKESVPGRDDYDLFDTHLTGTQIIDAETIIKLIGTKSYDIDGYMQVDEKTMKIAYEQIEELSNLGNHTESELLKEFAETQLLKNKISSKTQFDEAYQFWKNEKQDKEIMDYSKYWGVEEQLIKDSVGNFDVTKPNNIPYIYEILATCDYEKAVYKAPGGQLGQVIEFSNDLQIFIHKLKDKY